MMTNRLKEWSPQNNIVPEEHSVIQSWRSTLDYIENISQQAFDHLQENKHKLHVDMVFKAAFDRVKKHGFLRNLGTFGLTNLSFHWLRTWLAGRPQSGTQMSFCPEQI